MSQSKTPRTDHLINVILGRRVALDPEYTREQTILDHARDLEVDLTRLSAEKAELHTALLQAREDALEEAAKVCESRISRRPTAYGEQPYIVADFCAAYIRALKSARQAEPQEGEKE